MLDKVKALIEEVKQFETESHEELEKFRIKFLGKKGVLTDLFAEFKNVEPQLKKRLWSSIKRT
jgi:phenylalanyl-tRNA synthetase alpha chain